MKIERISDNQIRCTLYKSDLTNRQLKMSELAYGTKKTRDLFQDMLIQASEELGFEVNDIPIVIEAVPVSAECMVLVITRVEDPDELDSRFSIFSFDDDYDDEDEDSDSTTDTNDDSENYMGADEIMDLFHQLQESFMKGLESDETPEGEELIDALVADHPTAAMRIYSFKSLNEVSVLAEVLSGQDTGINTLYKNPDTGVFYLIVNKSNLSPNTFNRICNRANEYGTREVFNYLTPAFYEEHYDCIIRNKALEVLSHI